MMILLPVVFVRGAGPSRSCVWTTKCAVAAARCARPARRADFDAVVLDGAAVIFQRLDAGGLAAEMVMGMSPISMRSGVVKKFMFIG